MIKEIRIEFIKPGYGIRNEEITSINEFILERLSGLLRSIL